MRSLKLKANAKINLTLGITGKREDGYHTLDGIMQSVDLYDRIEIAKSDKISVECDVNGLSQEDNIAFSAARLFFEETGIKAGADISIQKHIPTAAGLGGGSADAAAVLCGLDRLYETALPYDELCSFAIKLGADVPFFIRGGTQRVGGIGEQLTPVAPLKDCLFLLIKYGDKTSTADMYKKSDMIRLTIPDTAAAAAALFEGNITELAKNIGNSFTAFFDYSELIDMLEPSEPLCVSLSGSGPTVFAMYNSLKGAAFAEAVLKSNNIMHYFARPTDCGIEFE